MRATARNKADRMLASEERKLAALIPALMVKFNLAPDPDRDECYAGRSPRFNCDLLVHPIVLDSDGHPWLACRFHRPYPRLDLPWNAPENRAVFRDIQEAIGANSFSGKCNAHIFSRTTAEDALHYFDSHLHWLTGVNHAQSRANPV